MLEILKRILRLLPSLLKILNTIVEVLEDFADDGKRNHSTTSGSGEGDK